MKSVGIRPNFSTKPIDCVYTRLSESCLCIVIVIIHYRLGGGFHTISPIFRSEILIKPQRAPTDRLDFSSGNGFEGVFELIIYEVYFASFRSELKVYSYFKPFSFSALKLVEIRDNFFFPIFE